MLEEIKNGIMISLAFFSLVILFCIMLVRTYFTKIKKYTQQLYQKDIEYQKTLNTAIVETQEQVLNNISQDLHDDAGQQLTAINFQLENLKLDSPELKEVLDPISGSVGRLADSIRNISHSLNIQLLAQQDLLTGIRQEISRLQRIPRLNITSNVIGKDPHAFSVNEKIFIYRIFQEAISNTLKHARASEIEITIDTRPRFQMTIWDNGKGFEPGTAQSSGIGLKNMVHRASIIDYTLVINSAPQNGTTITLTQNS